MDVTLSRKKTTLPVRHIAITGSTAKSCRRLKLLLKNTGYFCLVDCYKTIDELVNKESFYLPDYVIIEIRTMCAILYAAKRIARLKEVLPEIKILVYYNMATRYPLLEQKHRQYPFLHFRDDEQKQLQCLEHVLKNEP